MTEFLPPFRSDKVLRHARGQPCTLRFRVCNRNPETTVACHIRDRHKGMGTKASDMSICFGCADCHAYLDEARWIGEMQEIDVLRTVLRAMQETHEILIRDGIIGFPHNPPISFVDKPVRPRKPKDMRAKMPVGRPLQGTSTWPKGRKIQSRNDLRKEQ